MVSQVLLLKFSLAFFLFYVFFFESRRRHTRCSRDWSSDVCSSDLDSASLEEVRSGKAGAYGHTPLQHFYSHPLTILEAKSWGRRLNDTDPKDTLDTRDPTAQTVKYLDDLYHASQSRIQWAILTNGKEWRLFYYRAESRSGNFFEINLENIIAENDREKFLYFYLFFSKDAFIPDLATGKTWLDLPLDGSAAS